MKIHRPIAATLFLIICGAACGADEPVTAKFKTLEEEWSCAIKAQEKAKLEEFLRPEYTLTVARAGQLARTDRASWLQNAITGYVLQEFHFDELTVLEYAQIAVVSSRYTQKATFDGRDRSGEFFLTDIWVKTGDRWQVSARYSSRPEPATPAIASTPSSR